MTTSTQATLLAAQFVALNDAALAAIAGCTAEGWQRITASEGWTVAAAAHHFASVQQGFVGLVTTLASGETFSPSPGMDDIDRSNAQHAEEYAAADRAEILALLRTSGEAIAGLLGGLDDAGLDRIAGTFGGHELRVAQVLEYVIIGHARYHLGSIQETLAA
jgi:uncharacterized damage-inducible protein DinB